MMWCSLLYKSEWPGRVTCVRAESVATLVSDNFLEPVLPRLDRGRVTPDYADHADRGDDCRDQLLQELLYTVRIRRDGDELNAAVWEYQPRDELSPPEAVVQVISDDDHAAHQRAKRIGLCSRRSWSSCPRPVTNTCSPALWRTWPWQRLRCLAHRQRCRP